MPRKFRGSVFKKCIGCGIKIGNATKGYHCKECLKTLTYGNRHEEIVTDIKGNELI